LDYLRGGGKIKSTTVRVSANRSRLRFLADPHRVIAIRQLESAQGGEGQTKKVLLLWREITL
jgi:hypothetical protein